MLQAGGPAVPDDWLRVLTKDDLAAGCQEAWLSALPSKAKKDEWVAHASGQLSLHHLGVHGLEKICKHNKLSAFQGKPKAQLIKLLETAPASVYPVPTAVQPDIADAMANLVIDRQSVLSDQRLQVLTCEQLQELCRARILPAYGNKQDMIRQLRQDNMTLKELSKSELKALCKAEQLAISGNIATLIERLQLATASHAAPPVKQQQVHDEQKAQEVAVSQSGDLLQAGKKMTRGQYANVLRREGLLETDQDVFHIIASANGGADHTHNYHFAQNQSWNRAIGSQHDFINCYIAGKIKAEKAVAISRQLGNGSVTYSGPDAMTLYRMGEDIMRTMRREHRNDWVTLMQARA